MYQMGCRDGLWTGCRDQSRDGCMGSVCGLVYGLSIMRMINEENEDRT